METLKSLLQRVYGETAGVELLKKTESIVAEHNLTKTDVRLGHGTPWHDRYAMYVTYPESFQSESGQRNFYTLSRALPYIRSLGCDAIHVLPFLESPMIDMGFDVSNYKKVRRDLGGLPAIESFLTEAKRCGIRPFMDIILNHVSEEHAWYRSAIAGDSDARELFISRSSTPPFIKVETDHAGFWALYEEPQRNHRVRIIFPEQVGEIPHWRQAKDGNWYYHTFYPQQLDLNWLNPKVFAEFADILCYWSAKGFSFRLDAIAWLGKESYYDEDSLNNTNFLIVEALREVVEQVNPDSVFLVEAAQLVVQSRPYFQGNYRRPVELSYNFELTKAIWSSLVGAPVEGIWKRLALSAEELNGAQWVTFLRNHDELCIELAQPEEVAMILKELDGRGPLFRNGTNISGRTFSLLGQNIERHLIAHLLLLSLPGSPALYFGDEILKQNDLDYMKLQSRLKRERLGLNSVQDDTRDCHRAPILAEELADAGEVYQKISHILRTRFTIPEMWTAYPTKITQDLPETVFAGTYKIASGELMVLINLGTTSVTVELPPRECNPVLEMGKVCRSENIITVAALSGAWIRVRAS